MSRGKWGEAWRAGRSNEVHSVVGVSRRKRWENGAPGHGGASAGRRLGHRKVSGGSQWRVGWVTVTRLWWGAGAGGDKGRRGPSVRMEQRISY